MHYFMIAKYLFPPSALRVRVFWQEYLSNVTSALTVTSDSPIETQGYLFFNSILYSLVMFFSVG